MRKAISLIRLLEKFEVLFGRSVGRGRDGVTWSDRKRSLSFFGRLLWRR